MNESGFLVLTPKCSYVCPLPEMGAGEKRGPDLMYDFDLLFSSKTYSVSSQPAL